MSQAEACRLSDALPSLWRLRVLVDLAFGPRGAQRHANLVALARRLQDLYLALWRSQQATVIVDTTKMPTLAYLLQIATDLDVRIVHLVRDPRGVASSWRKDKLNPQSGPQRYMGTKSWWSSIVTWSIWNAASETMWRRPASVRRSYLLVRYEDLVRQPRELAQQILRMAGLESARLPFVDDDTVELGPGHSIGGNPDRMRHGKVAFRADESWMQEEPPQVIRAMSLLAAPMLLHYGYPLLPKASVRRDA
jgi:hypothetical protein